MPSHQTLSRSILILSPNLRLGLFLSGLSKKNPICISPVSHIWHVPQPFVLLNLVTQIIFVEELLVMQSALLPCYLVLLTPSILLSTLFSNNLRLYSTHHARDQVSHPYKTTQKKYSFVYFNLNIFGQHAGRQKFLQRKTESSP